MALIKHWTEHDLLAYNITIVDKDVTTFFGNSNLPELTVLDPIILNNRDKPPGALANSTRLFFAYLNFTKREFPPIESAAPVFFGYLLSLLGYDQPDRYIHKWRKIGFIMSGIPVNVKTDICVLDEEAAYLLLVKGGKVCHIQRNKKRQSLIISKSHAEPRLIAAAIAAFYENNNRRRLAGLAAIQAKEFAGITFRGTAPMFYKIPITTNLLESIATAQFPPQQTIVQRLIPPVPNMSRLLEDGMIPLDNRRVILQCFEAFKQFLQ